MLLATFPKTEKRIYDQFNLIGLKITIESQKHRTEVSQCHRCQRFGHSQNKCKAQARCVKCAGKHLTAECRKEKSAPAKCANCGEAHTASCRGCNQWPALPTNNPPTRKVNKELSYAKAASENTENNEPTLSILLKQFQSLYDQMQSLGKHIGAMSKSTEIPNGRH